MQNLQRKLLLVWSVLMGVVVWCAGTDPWDTSAGRLTLCASQRSELLGVSHSCLADTLALKGRVSGLMETQERLHRELFAERQEHGGVLNEHLVVLDAYGSLQGDHLTLRNENEVLQGNHLTLQQDLMTLQKESKALQEDHSGLQDDHEDCLQHLDSLGKDAEAVEVKLHSLEKKHRGLLEDNRHLQQDHDSQRGILRVLQQEKEELSLLLRKKEQDYDILNREFAAASHVKHEVVKSMELLHDKWQNIDLERRQQHESLSFENQRLKLKIQDMNDKYLKIVREKDEQERFYLDSISTCEIGKTTIGRAMNAVVKDMLRSKDKMMQHLHQMQENNTNIWREKDAMQLHYDLRLNVCLNERKADKARAEDEMVKFVEMQENAIETYRKIESNLSHVNDPELIDLQTTWEAVSQEKEEILRQDVVIDEQMEQVTQGEREAGESSQVEEPMKENEHDIIAGEELGKEVSEIPEIKYWKTEKIEEEPDGEIDNTGISSEDIPQNTRLEDELEVEETLEGNKYKPEIKELKKKLKSLRETLKRSEAEEILEENKYIKKIKELEKKLKSSKEKLNTLNLARLDHVDKTLPH